MSTKLFNFTNQKLNANKLREVLAFNSNNFSGIISSDGSPFTISGDTITLNASEESPISIIGGGLIINETSTKAHSLLYDNNMWFLEVILDPNSANITTDELIETVDDESINKLSYKSISLDFVEEPKNYFSFSVVSKAEGSPEENHYYEIVDDSFKLSEDTEVDPEKVYYYKIDFTSFKFKALSLSTATYSYYGNTIWTSDNTFIVPLFVRINGEIIQLVHIRSLEDFKELLSASSYSKLKAYSEDTFVWRSGGAEKGDIGSLNITEDTISNRNTGYPVKLSKLAVNSLADKYNSWYTKLIVDSSGNISADSNYVESVEHGGTGAVDRQEAKRNLGIFYGKEPSPSSYKNVTYHTAGGIKKDVISPYKEGDLYLWIIE